MILNRKQKYLQIALNRSLAESEQMIRSLPASRFIILEAGTPFIKEYGQAGIRSLVSSWRGRVGIGAYVVADMKCMDRGATEVELAAAAGASALTCLGQAPIETIDEFIARCQANRIDSMLDMLNVPFPFEVLSKLKKQPDIVVLHRGVDESQKEIPYYEINRIRGAYNIIVSIAGGESLKETKRAYFNGADIAVVWRHFNESPAETRILAEQFLHSIKAYVKSAPGKNK